MRKLPAGHLLTVTVDPWQVNQYQYWNMEAAEPVPGNPTARLREELDTISELVIRSDVPVGVALSGGLDSSAIAVLAARRYPGVMHAFSVGYPDRPPCDERADAKALADHLGLPFHDVELSTSEMTAAFPSLNYWRDDPIADISGFGYLMVDRLAREHGVSGAAPRAGRGRTVLGLFVDAAGRGGVDRQRTDRGRWVACASGRRRARVAEALRAEDAP